MPSSPENEQALLTDIAEVATLATGKFGVEVGIGDDAAVLQFKAHEQMVLSCDSLSEGVDFRRTWASISDIAKRSTHVNLSDLAAMGAAPRALLLCLNLPKKNPLNKRDIIRLCKYIHKSGLHYGAPLIGGDLNSFDGPLTLSITAIGSCTTPLRRYRGTPGDIIAVSGTLGDAAAGLQVLERWKEEGCTIPKPKGKLVQRLLNPTPRLDFGQALSRASYAGVISVADVSDGLATDVMHILRAQSPSALRACLHSTRLPLSRPLRQYINMHYQPQKHQAAIVDLALRGGDDYELVLSVPPKIWPRVQATAKRCCTPLTAIGHIQVNPEHSGAATLEVDGIPLRDKGFDHFT